MTTQVITILNELTLGSDGWAQIAPYGDFPGVALIPDGRGGFRQEQAIQRLDKAAVSGMVAEYAANTRGISGFFKKRPLFVGHPDVPGFETRYPDKGPKGVFANLAAREDGFFGEPILTEEGEQLIAAKTYRALSGRWEAQFLCEEVLPDGRKAHIYRPVKFLSAGLTNQPNLPVQLLNEAETQTDSQRNDSQGNKTGSHSVDSHAPDFVTQSDNPNMKKIITWLTRHGITLTNEGTEDQVESALAQLEPKFANSAALEQERDAARAGFANERKARIDAEIVRAVRDGRITDAERATWEMRLSGEAQFANELAALNSLAPKIKTASVTIDRGERKAGLAGHSERRNLVRDILVEIANEKHWDSARDYDRCWAEAQRRHPALFNAMAKPSLAAGRKLRLATQPGAQNQ